MHKRDPISAILVDGSNLYATMKALGFSVDYKRLLHSFDGTVLKAYYFTAMRPAEELSTLRPTIDYLVYNGWSVIQKETRKFVDPVTGETKEKGNMDIEMAVIAMEIAPYVTDLHLFTGDGDFRFLVEAIQRRYAVNINVVSSIKTSPPMCADMLRRQADSFTELADIKDAICRTSDKRRDFLYGKEG